MDESGSHSDDTLQQCELGDPSILNSSSSKTASDELAYSPDSKPSIATIGDSEENHQRSGEGMVEGSHKVTPNTSNTHTLVIGVDHSPPQRTDLKASWTYYIKNELTTFIISTFSMI